MCISVVNKVGLCYRDESTPRTNDNMRRRKGKQVLHCMIFQWMPGYSLYHGGLEEEEEGLPEAINDGTEGQAKTRLAALSHVAR